MSDWRPIYTAPKDGTTKVIVPGVYGVVVVEQPVVQRGVVCISLQGANGNKDKVLLEKHDLIAARDVLDQLIGALDIWPNALK